MLKQRTSSANQLRIESALRHNVRNLRAKVRSILPQELCPRAIKRNQTLHLHETSNNPKQRSIKPQLEIAKKLCKQFDKLSLPELEEINANKHYFFGNDKAIAYYEQYISDNHPEMKSKEFAPPTPPDPNEHIVLSFIPFNLLLRRQHHSRQSNSSAKNIFGQKRGSTTSSVHHRKQSSLYQQDMKFQPIVCQQKVQHCLSKKQQIDEQKRVRRQISYMNWQRQQQVATANRHQHLQEKVNAARSTHSPGKFQRSKQRNAHKLLEQHEIAGLTSKLRKICLKRRQACKSTDVGE